MSEQIDKKVELEGAIEYYARLIKSGLKMLEDEEIDLLLSERDAIHGFISSMSANQAALYEDKIRLLDRDLLSQVDLADFSQFNHSEYPSDLWWWHLGELNELTDQQKATL